MTSLQLDRKLRGDCTRCGRPAIPNLQLCARCREPANARTAAADRKRRATRRQLGLCALCGDRSAQYRCERCALLRKLWDACTHAADAHVEAGVASCMVAAAGR